MDKGALIAKRGRITSLAFYTPYVEEFIPAIRKELERVTNEIDSLASSFLADKHNSDSIYAEIGRLTGMRIALKWVLEWVERESLDIAEQLAEEKGS